MNRMNDHHDEMNDDVTAFLNFVRSINLSGGEDTRTTPSSLSSSQLAPRDIHDHGIINAYRSNHSLLLTSQSGIAAATVTTTPSLFGRQNPELVKSMSARNIDYDHSSSSSCCSSSSSCPDEITSSFPTLHFAKKTNLPLDRNGRLVSRSHTHDSPRLEPGGGITTQRRVPNKEEKNNNVARCHDEHGVSQLVAEPVSKSPKDDRNNTTTLATVENDPMVEHIVIDGHDTNSTKTTATTTAQTNSVYFGFIKHPATITWRDVVKRFSQNCQDFPCWTDDIGDKVIYVLRMEKGIVAFFMSRRSTSGLNTKKIVDKNSNLVGEWSPATDQEILYRTKQRFNDDRKRSAAGLGAKLPIGRPPKAVSRHATKEDNHLGVVQEKDEHVEMDPQQQQARPLERPIANEMDNGDGDNYGRVEATMDPNMIVKIANETGVYQPNVVYFGIQRPGTTTWRKVVKSCSDKYLDWSDAVYRQVRHVMKNQQGIDCYLVLQGQGKKILDKSKQALGTWRIATDEEICDKTRQRFLNDRKAPATAAVPAGPRRSRGRPRKVVVPDDSSLVVPTALSNLEKILIKWQGFFKMHNNNDLLDVRDDGSLEELDSKSSLTRTVPRASVEQSNILEVMQDLERMQQHLRYELEKALSEADRKNNKASDMDSTARYETTGSYCEQPAAKKCKRSHSDGIVVQNRNPCFPILPEHVCLGWNHHPGTVKWLKVVNGLARDPGLFPNWQNTMAGLVKEKLEQQGCLAALVSPDSQYRPGKSIQNAQWYPSTDEEFTEWTKKQFMDARRESPGET